MHGGTGTSAFDWEYQRPWLRDEFEVYSIDLRAHGSSTDPRRLLSMYVIGNDVMAFLSELAWTRKPVVMGFSAGGTAVLMCLARDPALATAISGLVLVAASVKGAPPTTARAIQAGRWPEDLVRLSHPAWPDPAHWRKLRQVVSTSWSKTCDISGEELGRIACPILAVAGAKDPVEPPETAVTIARSVRNGRAAVIDGAGHLAMRHRPDEFRAAVEPFLRRAAGLRGPATAR